MPNKKLLSKTKYMSGRQCLKYLWLLYNDPGKVPGPDSSTQRIFDQGHQVGELAKKLFPGGIDIPHDNFNDNLTVSKKLLAERKPLFEPGFYQNSLFSRLDILNPAGEKEWDIIEVKSSASVKDENLHDISFQRHCCEKAGLKINRCFLAFINSQYVRNGEIDPFELFRVQDVTEQVNLVVQGIENRILKMQTTIASPTCPEVHIGECCESPYDCPVTLCREGLPENNIFDLHNGGNKCYQLYHDGVLKVDDIPDDCELNQLQQIQRACETSQIPHVDKPAIKEFLSKIKSPVYYLHFETYNPAIPLFDGVKPYQKIPFQYSLQVVDGGGTRDYSYLAEGRNDPRPELLRNLKEAIGSEGSIVTYNLESEEGVLKGMAQAFPEYLDWAEGICRQMLDLSGPFKNFDYYHPEQHGSVGLKSVLPALTGKRYGGLNIAIDDAARGAFLTVTYGKTTEDKRLQVRTELEKYCCGDTEGMIWMVKKLRDLVD